MKQIFLSLTLCMVLGSCSSKYATITNSKKDYQIIPKPTSLKIKMGKFLPDANTKVMAASELENEGKYLSNLLSNIVNKNIVFENEGSKKGNISLQLDASIDNEEGYKLVVNYDKIIISGKTAAGVFYGIQTLSQLMQIEKDLAVLTIPATEIEDSPRYVYRGMHLDVVRHFFPVFFVKKNIDILAMHKMNTFHWHLTDDQGWRIEIKKYPKLTSIGSIRKETIVGTAILGTNLT